MAHAQDRLISVAAFMFVLNATLKQVPLDLTLPRYLNDLSYIMQ